MVNIIVAGLGKTGTSSLKVALEILGFSVAHYGVTCEEHRYVFY